MTTLSSEELQAQRSDFGLRLSNSMAKYGRCVWALTRIASSSPTGDTTSTPKAPNSSPCVCCRPPTGAPQQSNSRRRCSSATEPKVSKRSSACSTRHDKWRHHHRRLPARRPVHHDFRHRRRLFQARCTVAGRRHHAAAVLWRAFVERPDYRSAGKRTRRVHRLPDLQPGRHESADRVAPERRLQGTYRGLRHRLHRAEA